MSHCSAIMLCLSWTRGNENLIIYFVHNTSASHWLWTDFSKQIQGMRVSYLTRELNQGTE